MKSEVHKTKVDNRDKLCYHIMDDIDSIKDCYDAFRRATRHVLSRDAKCMAVDGGILDNVLYWVKIYRLFHLNNKYRLQKQYVITL